MTAAPDRLWWTAAQIAEADLPGLPATRQGVERLIAAEDWRARGDLARRRAGRGGGWEYHWHLLPQAAQQALLAHAATPVQDAAPAPGPAAAGPALPGDRTEVWAWYDAQPDAIKAQAQARLEAVRAVEALVAGGATAQVAAATVAPRHKVSERSLWGWLARVRGLREDDRLPHLAPRHRLDRRPRRRRETSPEFMDAIKSDYLRPAGPSFATVYRRAVRIAQAQGWDVLPERTARRRFDAEVSEMTCILARQGVEALRRRYPAQVRDKTALRALEVVNADFHRFDVFVRFPAEGGENADVVARPQMCAFQDVHSGRVLAWRVDRTPNALAVQLCAGDLVEDWGIPEHVLFDNGREFAAKAITGGAQTRYRFKVREDDLPGLFVALGVEIHWANPYSGQSKPIERAFRDMCDAIAKDPRFDGAYTGNTPLAKPEDYGSRAIPLEDFLSVLAEGIEEHNTRQGRRSEVAWGRSFAEVFDESYARGPIRRATEAQRRLWMLGAEGLRVDARTGVLRHMGNEYWADWLHGHLGAQVIARFDPADLWAGLHVYSADNAYLGHAPVRMKAGFFDLAEARAHARARKTWQAAERKAAAAHKVYTAAQLGQMLDGAAPPPRPAVEAKVVAPVFGQGLRARAVPDAAAEAAAAAAQAGVVADLAARRGQADAPEDDERSRFRRALEIEQALADGHPVTPDQQRWLSVYQATPEYRGQRMLWEDFGEGMFG